MRVALGADVLPVEDRLDRALGVRVGGVVAAPTRT
jgi:hypothetical protein